MKLPFMAAAILPLIAGALAGCAPGTIETSANRPLNSREFVRVGEVMIHVDASESLPPGPTLLPDKLAAPPEKPKDLGISELDYMGLNTGQQPMFRRRDIDFVIAEGPDKRKVLQRMPEKTGWFALDYSRGRYITLRTRTVEIIDATPAGVTFSVQ